VFGFLLRAFLVQILTHYVCELIIQTNSNAISVSYSELKNATESQSKPSFTRKWLKKERNTKFKV
jgi:hypothetical protein